MKKIPKKFTPLVTGILMAILMSGIVTFINRGFPENFFIFLMNSFLKVAPIAFGVVIVVRPIVEKLVKKLVE